MIFGLLLLNYITTWQRDGQTTDRHITALSKLAELTRGI